MGFFNKIKGALNIGGLSVKFGEVENPFPLSSTIMNGTYILSTKSDKEVLSTVITFKSIHKRKNSDGEEETEEMILASHNSEEVHNPDFKYPFTMKEGETKEIAFALHNINVEKRDSDEKGFVGSLAKASNFLNSDSIKYILEIDVDIKGTPLDPSDEVEIKIDMEA